MLSVLIMAAAMHLGPVLDTFAQIILSASETPPMFPGGLALGVVVSNNYAYLANGYDGLRIYDVSDPTNPTMLAISITAVTRKLWRSPAITPIWPPR